MYRLFIACFFAGTLLATMNSCGGNATTEESTTTEAPSQSPLEKEVMAIHDEAMPMNSELVRTSESLMAILEGNTDLDSDQQIALKTTIKALNYAEESMMEWMANYSVEGKSDAEKEAYLKAEAEKINQIKVQMEEALEMGKAKLAELSGNAEE